MLKAQTKTAKNISDVALQIGDSLHKKFDETQDLKVANIALKSYSLSLKAHRDIMAYKRQTGKPASILFYEK